MKEVEKSETASMMMSTERVDVLWSGLTESPDNDQLLPTIPVVSKIQTTT